MTHPIYSQTTLELLTITELKTIASQIGAIPDGDKRVKQAWVSAVLDHQIKFSPAKVEAMERHIETVMNRIEEVPTELTEDLTLTLLGLEIIDREDYTDECVPHGEVRYLVTVGDEPKVGISTWGNRFVLTSGKTYATLFEASTSFLSRGELALAYSDAQNQLRERFNTAIDYI